MQSDGDTHDTPFSNACHPGGNGVRRAIHRLPLNDAEAGVAASPVDKGGGEFPTATQAITVGHDTLSSSAPCLRRGIGSTVQCRPFQRAASSLIPVAFWSLTPTAVHETVDGHDTLTRPAEPSPFCVFHRARLKRCTKLKPTPPLVLAPPTAVQALAEEHETLLSRVATAL